MKWLFYIIAAIVLIPAIIYLLRILAGIIGLCLGIIGIVLLFTGNIWPGIILLVIAAFLSFVVPEIDPDCWTWYD